MMYRQCITDLIRSWIGGILGQWFGQGSAWWSAKIIWAVQVNTSISK